MDWDAAISQLTKEETQHKDIVILGLMQSFSEEQIAENSLSVIHDLFHIVQTLLKHYNEVLPRILSERALDDQRLQKSLIALKQ